MTTESNTLEQLVETVTHTNSVLKLDRINMRVKAIESYFHSRNNSEGITMCTLLMDLINTRKEIILSDFDK